jgi:hypothetical protein
LCLNVSQLHYRIDRVIDTTTSTLEYSLRSFRKSISHVELERLKYAAKLSHYYLSQNRASTWNKQLDGTYVVWTFGWKQCPLHTLQRNATEEYSEGKP